MESIVCIGDKLFHQSHHCMLWQQLIWTLLRSRLGLTHLLSFAAVGVFRNVVRMFNVQTTFEQLLYQCQQGSGELIVSRYVAESITTDCRTFWPCRPLSTVYKIGQQGWLALSYSDTSPSRELCNYPILKVTLYQLPVLTLQKRLIEAGSCTSWKPVAVPFKGNYPL